MKNTSGITRRAGLGLLAGAAAAGPLSGRGLGSDITIGALLSLTGEWSTAGISSKALIEIAVAEINALFESTQTPGRVTLLVEDTKLEPGRAVNGFRSLVGAGAKLIIGPLTSAEAGAILPLLDEAGAIAISHGSTSGALSRAGDSLYRFVPDDGLEAEALAALARARNAHTIVPVWRDDAGSRGIAVALRRSFTSGGGRVTRGIEYPSERENFPAVAQEILRQLPPRWEDEGGVLVQLSAYDEVVDLFKAAGAVDGLSRLPWLGSNGTALRGGLLADKDAAMFAARTGYLAPTFMRPPGAREKAAPLLAAAKAKTGIEPDVFALAGYDACWCGVLARLLAGGNYAPTWKAFLPHAAELYFGATGWGRLNANGDRAVGDYEFWGLPSLNNEPPKSWAMRATYQGGVVFTATQGVGMFI
jgi:branched-chain amino acid transport system substrate-binding protein